MVNKVNLVNVSTKLRIKSNTIKNLLTATAFCFVLQSTGAQALILTLNNNNLLQPQPDGFQIDSAFQDVSINGGSQATMVDGGVVTQIFPVIPGLRVSDPGSRLAISGGNVLGGLSLIDRGFVSLSGGMVNAATVDNGAFLGVDGGVIGDVDVSSSGVMSMLGGSAIGALTTDNGVITVGGGGTVNDIQAVSRGIVNIQDDAVVNGQLTAGDNAVINMFGGVLNNQLTAGDNSRLSIFGGSFLGGISVSGNSFIEIRGRNFTLNGSSVAFGLIDSADIVNGNIRGILANNNGAFSNVNFSSVGSNVRVLLRSSVPNVPEPSPLALLALGLVLFFFQSFRRRGLSSIFSRGHLQPKFA